MEHRVALGLAGIDLLVIFGQLLLPNLIPVWVLYVGIGFGLLLVVYAVIPRSMFVRSARPPIPSYPTPADRRNSKPAALAPAIPMSSSDPKKVSLIGELYPLLYDLSETHVDHMGDAARRWREPFLSGKASEYFTAMNLEQRSVVAAFEKIRPIFARHRFYSDIYRMDDAIAQALNLVGQELGSAREVSRHLSDRFDENSLALVEPKLQGVMRAIGALRQFLTKSMHDFVAMRTAASR